VPEAPGDGVEVGAGGQELGGGVVPELLQMPPSRDSTSQVTSGSSRRRHRYVCDAGSATVSAIGLLRIMPAQARLPRAMSVSDEVMPIRKDVKVLEPWWQRLHRNRPGLGRIKRGPLAS
jgi:hypothetical protein